MWDPIESIVTPPMGPPVIITVSAFTIGTILAGYELVSSSRNAPPPPPSTTTGGTIPPVATTGGGTINLPPRSKNNFDSSANNRPHAAELSDSPVVGGGGGGDYNNDGQQQQQQRGGSGKKKSGRGQRGVSGAGQFSSSSTVAVPGTPSPSSSMNSERGPPGGDKGGRSSGDNTRRAFYKLIFVALLSRSLLLPLEALSLTLLAHPLSHPLLVSSRTIPSLAFASAFSLLVLFYAQLAGTATAGRSTTAPSRGWSLLLTQRYFVAVNGVVYGTYVFLLILTSCVPTVFPHDAFRVGMGATLCGIYGCLLGLLGYFGPVLVGLLRPSLARRSGLALRLVGMCVLCTVVFLTRCVSFGMAAWRVDLGYTRGFVGGGGSVDGVGEEEEVDGVAFFKRDAVSCVLVELIPSLAILFMMHQRRGGGTVSPGGGGVGGAVGGVKGAGMGGYGSTTGVAMGGFGATAGVNGAGSSTGSGGHMRRNTSGSDPKGEKGPLLLPVVESDRRAGNHGMVYGSTMAGGDMV